MKCESARCFGPAYFLPHAFPSLVAIFTSLPFSIGGASRNRTYTLPLTGAYSIMLQPQMVERWGIEPQIPDCRSGVFPLALPPQMVPEAGLEPAYSWMELRVASLPQSIPRREPAHGWPNRCICLRIPSIVRPTRSDMVSVIGIEPICFRISLALLLVPAPTLVSRVGFEPTSSVSLTRCVEGARINSSP